MKIFQVVKRDLKILIRSKLSALIILLGPLLIVSLIGLAFNSSDVNNIKIGTYSSSYSDLGNNLVNALKGSQFTVINMTSEKECINSIKTQKINVCMIIPGDLKVENNNDTTNSSEIVFYVDNSRINLVYFVISEVSKKVNLQSKEIAKGLTDNILYVLSDSKVKLIDNKDSIQSIKEGTSSINEKADSITEQMDSFDVSLDTNSLGVNSLINGSLSCGSNCSAEYLDKVETLVNKLNSLKTNVDTVNNAKESILSSAEAIRSESTKTADSLTMLQSDVDSIIANIDALPIQESDSIVNPIRTTVKPISEDGSNLRFVFPTLIAMVVMLVSLLLSSTIVIREKKSRAYFRNFITPTNNFTFIIGTFVTCLLILILQLIVIFVEMYFTSPAQIMAMLNPSLLLIIFLIAMVFILIGMLIGYSFQTEETSTLATFSIATIFLFLSNTILPIESIPIGIRWIALFNPFVITDAILKKMILFDFGILEVLTEIYVLIAYAALFWSLVYLARLVNKRRLA